MQYDLDNKTVSDLLELRSADMLYANREYQRGAVWSTAQKKMLVDSVLRGYAIPLIYLHHISKQVAGHRLDKFEVIDGQQRINALYEYREGSFKLLIRKWRLMRMRPSFRALFNWSLHHGRQTV